MNMRLFSNLLARVRRMYTLKQDLHAYTQFRSRMQSRNATRFKRALVGREDVKLEQTRSSREY